jgi:hypothetical protein
MSSVPRYRWDSSDLANRDIPQSAKAFLATKGLPISVGVTTIEFGPYDSPDAFVIGQVSDFAIYLAADGTVWHDNSDGKEGDQFMNSSVELLGRFIDAVETLSIPPDASDEEARAIVRSTIACLESLDGAAFADRERWLWALYWEDVLSLC